MPQFQIGMACFSHQAIKSGLKDVSAKTCQEWGVKTCCLDNRERSLNLLPPEVDKGTSPGAWDNMPTIVRVGESRGSMLRGATTWGINHRIPRMLRATGFNYSGRGRAARCDENSSDCICRREKLKSGGGWQSQYL